MKSIIYVVSFSFGEWLYLTAMVKRSRFRLTNNALYELFYEKFGMEIKYGLNKSKYYF